MQKSVEIQNIINQQQLFSEFVKIKKKSATRSVEVGSQLRASDSRITPHSSPSAPLPGSPKSSGAVAKGDEGEASRARSRRAIKSQ